MSRVPRTLPGLWILLLAVALVAGVSTLASAQDGAAGGGDTTTPEPIVGKGGVVGDEGSQVTDPSDDIVLHIVAMTKLVKDNIDKPDVVKQEFKTYIDSNGDSMKDASDRFEAHLNGLESDEREAYKQKLQRKMESALADFLEAMLDFSERHPEAAAELDEMLQTTSAKK